MALTIRFRFLQSRTTQSRCRRIPGLRVRTVVWPLAAALLVLNFADFLTTWFAITYQGALESNGVLLMLGGPLSRPSIVLKLVVMPCLILGAAWWATRKFKDPLPAVALIVPSVVMFGSAVVNNVWVIRKKVRKIAGMKQPSPDEVTKT